MGEIVRRGKGFGDSRRQREGKVVDPAHAPEPREQRPVAAG
jgi:hypothetical protein